MKCSKGSRLRLLLVLSSVPAQKSKGFASWQGELIIAVAEGDIVMRDDRNHERKDQQDHDQHKRDHCTFIGAETVPGIAQVADGFRLQLLVVNLLAALDECKFFLRNIRNIRYHAALHHFFEPMRIRGSIKP